MERSQSAYDLSAPRKNLPQQKGPVMRLFTFAAAAVSLAMPAAAQERCAARQDFVDRLEDVYQETQRVVALMPNEMVLEFFSTADGTTWTLIQTRLSDGYACLIAAGEGVAYIPIGDPA